MIDPDSLYLYHVTLRGASSFSHVCVGRFRGLKKEEEIVVASPTTLEVWVPDPETGKIRKETTQHAFGIIQNIARTRFPGENRDLLVITADSGKITIAQYIPKSRTFEPMAQEPHSKSFLRRNTPGPYIGVDPENRAVMIAALERNKLVYRMEFKDDKVVLSSPLEAINKNVLTFAVAALDVGFENPVFAALEVNYGTKKSMELNYYELDQSLNYITKSPQPVALDASASGIIPLPQTVGGCLIPCESYLVYHKPNHPKLYVPFPVREGSGKTIIVCHVVHRLPKQGFFVLMQSSLGDLFKVSVVMDEEEDQVRDIQITYFETIPSCNSIHILRSGFLFANVLHNSKMLFQIESLGDEDNGVIHLVEKWDEIIDKLGKFTFNPTSDHHLSLVDVMESLEPVVDASLVESVLKESPDPIKKLALLSSKSYLKEVQHGFPTAEVAESDLPFNATDVFITSLSANAANDEYMVITSSLAAKTIVLSIGEDVEEVTDSQFVTDQATLDVQQVGKLSLVQVYANGIRHVNTATKRTTDWFPPAGIHISQVTSNRFQVVIALTNFEVVYCEVDPVDDQLVEYQDRLEVASAVSAMGMLTTSAKKSPFVVIGCVDETIQVVSLSMHNCLEIKLMQALSSASSCIVIRDGNAHIGMEDGMFVTTSINVVTGKLSDSRSLYLGSRPVKLAPIRAHNSECVLAVSSGCFLGYSAANGTFKMTPLIDVDISSGGAINSDDLGEIIVGVSANKLRLYKLGTEDQDLATLEDDFSITGTKLRFQPKKMIVRNNIKYIIESEYQTRSPFASTELEANCIPKSSNKSSTQKTEFGYVRDTDSWASCIQVLDANNVIIQSIQLANNQAALSVCDVVFDSESSASAYVVVGVSTDVRYVSSVSSSSSSLWTFRVQKDGVLKYVHSTLIEGPATAMIAFSGMLLVGSQRYVRMYDLGRKQLLRKSTTEIGYLQGITRITYQGNLRIAIGDSNKSTVFATFDPPQNQFVVFADDTKNRPITALTALDYDTVIGGDKYGNVFVNRCSAEVSKMADEYWTKFHDGRMNGSGSRVHNLCEFYVDDIPTSFVKGSLVYGTSDSVIYTGIQGTIGLLMPLATASETAFLMRLQSLMRKYLDFNFDDYSPENNGPNLLGKDHAKFRGYYNPSKNVIDGDLIGLYGAQTSLVRQKIALELDRTVVEVDKKIGDLRLRMAY